MQINITKARRLKSINQCCLEFHEDKSVSKNPLNATLEPSSFEKRSPPVNSLPC